MIHTTQYKPVVAAHVAESASIQASLEGRQEGVVPVCSRHLGIEAKTRDRNVLWTTMYVVVLATGICLYITWVICKITSTRKGRLLKFTYCSRVADNIAFISPHIHTYTHAYIHVHAKFTHNVYCIYYTYNVYYILLRQIYADKLVVSLQKEYSIVISALHHQIHDLHSHTQPHTSLHTHAFYITT